MTDINSFLELFLHLGLPGFFGGAASFLFALKKGHYKNNKYAAKIAIEMIGAVVTAVFLLQTFSREGYTVALSFAVGFAWSDLLQALRSRITSFVLNEIEHNNGGRA